MSELRGYLEELRAEDLAGVSDQVLEEDFAEMQRAAQILEAERLRRLAELDRRRPYLRDGYLSTSTWFARRFGQSHSTAVGDLRLARALLDMPATTDALASGEISVSVARILAAARDSDPETFSEAEAMLVDAARRHSVRDLQRVVSYWRAAARDMRDPEGGGEEDLRDRRRLYASPTVFGMVRLDGDLDPEAGETVITALRAYLDAELRSPDPEDRRTPAQRRADALYEMCRQWMDLSDRPAVRGERPHVTVMVDIEALRGGPDGRAEAEHTGPITPKAARRWACDAALTRVLATGRPEPLDVGRKTPVVPAAIRRGVIVRDRHCTFPGCDRPPGWCDAHHVVHWADGGPTSLANLILLCRRHHRLVHHGFGVEMTGGRPVFRRPDGTVLEDGPPPWRFHEPRHEAIRLPQWPHFPNVGPGHHTRSEAPWATSST
jgi:Domain of unknown function (DUF222)/HNH endonuclease